MANEMAVQWECPWERQLERADTIPCPAFTASDDLAETQEMAALDEGDVERLVAEHDAGVQS